MTEYMVIDYIQSLNSYKVEGAQTEQELEGRYSKFRYFVEDLRNEIEKQGVQSDVVNIKDVKSDNSVQLTGLEFGYYLVDEITDVEGTHSAGSLCMVSTANPSAEMQVKSDYPSVIKRSRKMIRIPISQIRMDGMTLETMRSDRLFPTNTNPTSQT